METGSSRCHDAERCAPSTPGRSRTAGRAVAGADGGRRARRRRGGRDRSPARARRASSAARATTAATASSRRGACARPGFEVDVLLLWPADELSRRRRARTWSASTRRARGRGRRARRRARGLRASSSTRSSAPASRARRAIPAAAAIEAINACGAPVVAADIASGVDASTGEVAGARRASATITVTFHAAKLGHWVAPGKRHTGELGVAADRDPRRRPGRAGRRPDRPRGARAARRGADADSTKFTLRDRCWSSAARAASPAPSCLAASAAIRAGAGYATVAVPGGARADLRGEADRG